MSQASCLPAAAGGAGAGSPQDAIRVAVSRAIEHQWHRPRKPPADGRSKGDFAKPDLASGRDEKREGDEKKSKQAQVYGRGGERGEREREKKSEQVRM